MPNKLVDLEIDRVDLVDEGANSAAFIQLYKRKEQEDIMKYEDVLSKLNEEHAAIIKAKVAAIEKSATDATAKETDVIAKLTASEKTLATANDDLVKAKSELETLQKSIKADESDEETLMKSMSPEIRTEFMKMKTQKNAAETELKKANDLKTESIAKAKAATLKAIPVSEEVLVSVLKKADDELIGLLDVVSKAIESTVLKEKGANGGEFDVATQDAAWNEIQVKADEIAKAKSVTIAKAIKMVIEDHPELYEKYLGGTK